MTFPVQPARHSPENNGVYGGMPRSPLPQSADPLRQSLPRTIDKGRDDQILNIVDCLQDVPADVKRCVSDYLSTGLPQWLAITEEKFKHLFRIAQLLNHEKMLQLCLNFYYEYPNVLRRHPDLRDSLNVIDERMHTRNLKPVGVSQECGGDGNKRCYAVLFLTRQTIKEKQEVMIVDYTEKYHVIRPNLEKADSDKLQPGFACCTMYSKDSPYIVICGGHTNGRSFKRFDVVKDCWSRKSCKMKEKHLGHVVAYANGNVYIVGGKDCSAVEVYNACKNKCKMIGTLPVAVSGMSYEVYMDKLYIFGGKTARGDVASVQCIDTKTREIKRLPDDLPCQCSGGQAVAMGDVIYIATDQGHMIKFKPKTGESVLCAHQPFKRKNFTMYARNGNVFILGGVLADKCDVTTTDCDVSTVYTYLPERDCWKSSVSFTEELQISVCASCTVRYPNNKIAVYPFARTK